MVATQNTELLSRYAFTDPALEKLGLFMCESALLLQAAGKAGLEAQSMLVTKSYLSSNPSSVDFFRRTWPDKPLLAVDNEEFCQLMGFPLTRGPVSLIQRPKTPSLQELLAEARRIVIVEDSTNGANIASIFRSASAFRIDAVLISHSCIDPLQRRAARMSKGAALALPWLRVGSKWRWASEVLPIIKSFGFSVYGLALTDNSVPLDELTFGGEQKVAFILGTEGEGLCAQTMSLCDETVIIPMSEGIDSLNVSAASAIACWHLSNGR